MLFENGVLHISIHSTEEVDMLCDTVCEMDKGKLEKVR